MLGQDLNLIHLIGRDTPTYLLDTIAALRSEPVLPRQSVLFYGDGGACHPGLGKISRVRTFFGFDLLTRPPLRRRIADSSSSVVHVWSANALRWALGSVSKLSDVRLAPRTSSPVILADASALSDTHRAPTPQLNFVCHTRAELSRVRKPGVRREKCVLIRDPVDRAAIEAADRPTLRSRLHLTPEQAAVLVLPPLDRRTGAFTAAWAALLLEHARPGIRLIVPGNGRVVARISHMARSSELEHLLIRPGTRFSLAELLAAADLATYLPTKAAPLYGINWAMAAACPIVASDTPLVHDLLEHGRSAWLCAPDDPKHACRTMLRALENPTQSRQQAETARAQTNAAFDRRRILPQYGLVYENLLGGRRLDLGLDQVVLVD